MQQISLAQINETGYFEIFHDNAACVGHQFLFFIKPEITVTLNTDNLQRILHMMLDQFSNYHLSITRMNILGAAYLEKYHIIDRHYGVINSLSKDPRTFLSPEAKEKFLTLFHRSTDEVKLLGGIEFLQHYPSHTPQSLNDLWQAQESVKLGGGAYCVSLIVQGEPLYLINGFHPLQLIHFTGKKRSIVTFALCGNLNWSMARNQFIGKTNPQEAAPGSLRNRLLVGKKEYGLPVVSSSFNGFHLSAGPLEGLVELIRYGSDYSSGQIKTAHDYTFGKLLLQEFDENTVAKICSNVVVTVDGKKVPVFDLTEEKNSPEALELLKKAVFPA